MTSLLRYFGKLYSLDTLDTRFTISPTTPRKQAASETRIDPTKPSQEDLKSLDGQPNGYDGARKGLRTRPSLWNTPEFYLYYIVFILAVPMMFWVVIDVSRPSHPNYGRFAPLLKDGWIPGRKVDDSDSQYEGFREHILYMLLLPILHPLLRKAYDYLYRIDLYAPQTPTSSRSQLTQGLTGNAAADARLEHRITFDVFFASIFIIALHGFSAPKVVLILYTNFRAARTLPKEYIPAFSYIFNIGILFANELCRGYPYSEIAAFITPWASSVADDGVHINWGNYLDRNGGLTPRWEILFNFTVLRLISFNMDYYWSLNQQGGSPIEKKQLDPSSLSERDRVSTPAKSSDYNFRKYYAYALYSPLYLTGPIITFNDYISQLRYRPSSITTERTILYGVRFIVALLTMEIMIHYMYMVAIFKAKPDWAAYTPFQLSMLGFFNLIHIWLKLLLPWRFFRLWSLLDGVDPPENMVRCMSNNYSALAFWRGWHRSFNRWIVRYIYIPLGGSQDKGLWGKARAIGNFLIVFSFVAIWHDIQLRLLIWGWLITLFVLPEVVAGLLFPKKKWASRPNTYRVIAGVGAAGNILMMMAANLVGFAIGVDGLVGLTKGMFGSLSGVAFFVAAVGALFVGSQVMFEIREEEMREGIPMKC